MEENKFKIQKSGLSINPELTIENEINNDFRKLNPVLIKPASKANACIFYIVGRSGSGKSCLLYSLFHDEGKQRKYFKMFNNIHLFIPTCGVDIPWDLPAEKIHNEVNEDIVSEIFNGLETKKELDLRPSKSDKSALEEIPIKKKDKIYKKSKRVYNCFIFDDAISTIQNSKFFSHMFFNHRHKNLSIFIVSQGYRRFVKGFRDNVNGLIIFDTSKEILEEIFKEHIDSFRKLDKFLDICKFVFDKPFQFLYIKKGITGQEYYKNFDKIIF